MTVAFDLDGTLITCEPRQTSVLRAAGFALGYSVDLELVWGFKRDGLSTKDALCRCGLEQLAAARLNTFWQSIVEDPFWLELDNLFFDVQNVLLQSQAAGVRLVLITARSRPEWVTPQLQRLGLVPFFSAVECVSPRNATLEKAASLKRFGAEAYIGDTESDAGAANAAGVRFYGVTCGQRSAKRLRSAGVENIIEDYSELLNIIR